MFGNAVPQTHEGPINPQQTLHTLPAAVLSTNPYLPTLLVLCHLKPLMLLKRDLDAVQKLRLWKWTLSIQHWIKSQRPATHQEANEFEDWMMMKLRMSQWLWRNEKPQQPQNPAKESTLNPSNSIPSKEGRSSSYAGQLAACFILVASLAGYLSGWILDSLAVYRQIHEWLFMTICLATFWQSNYVITPSHRDKHMI